MKPWSIDAAHIGELSDINPEEDIIVTSPIKQFIETERDSMYFAVAPKGFGKTLLLMYKRYMYQKKHKKGTHREEICFIPHGNPVDRVIGPVSFSREKIDYLKVKDWQNIWSSCISLSIIKNLKTFYYKEKEENSLTILTVNLPEEICKIIEDPLLSTPYGYLIHILQLGYRSIIKIISNQYLLVEIIKGIHFGVIVFIDNIDECFREHLRPDEDAFYGGELDPSIWYDSQIGLMNAVWDLSGINPHIKIFASIRKEAYSKLFVSDDRSLQLKGSALDIKYSKEELKEMFIKNIERMNEKDLCEPDYLKEDPIYSFLELEENKITNTMVGKRKENIFDYIYRHTLKRARDFMIIGGELTRSRRTEDNIREVVDKAATAIITEYIEEIKPHTELKKFYNLFDLIQTNILTEIEIRKICRDFNNIKTCENKCKECETNHIFCNLYCIGLLGIVWEDPVTGKITQHFLQPGEKIFEPKILPTSKYYLLHPCLNSLIYLRSMSSGKTIYQINRRTIVGDGYEWRDPGVHRTTRYCSFINRICETDRSINKRGVFLASSYSNKSVVEDLSVKMKKLSLRLDIDKWMEREEPGTGRIFCNEVCPKIFRNFWMFAEVSDFNPNAFFECGFSLGLGREVIFLCKENSLVKNRLEKLYFSYKSVDNIIDKLEWTEEFFSNINVDSLYRTQRVFESIKDFNSANNRGRKDNVYVLTFNKEKDIIVKLSKTYGYKIIGPEKLNSEFIPVDLIEELINAKAVLINLIGGQREPTANKINDSQLMCLAGICVSQGIPVKIFQASDNFYSDIHDISLFDNSGERIVEYINGLQS